MSINIKKPDNRKLNQPTRDVEEIMNKSRKIDLNDNEEGLESDEERLKYIKDDLGL
jgi:hypothetical protein